jgi:adenylosuccinate synthase
MLDNDLGTYPFVTSSNPTSGGFLTGAGVPPRAIERIIGIAKAYTTRVGEGPFVTEEDNETGDKIREAGHEFGTTTGRPRRCGFLDLVILRYAARVNGITDIALMLLDVLDDFEEIKIATEYETGGEIIREFPASAEVLSECKPVYKKFKGWKKDITACKKFGELPSEAQDYINFIEKEVGVKISIVSVGPDREQTIIRK